MLALQRLEARFFHFVDSACSNKPKKSRLRWLFLIIFSLMICLEYFCRDTLCSLQTEVEKELNLSTTEFNFVYTVYSISSSLVPIFGGVVSDKLGKGLGMLIYLIISLVSQLILIYGLVQRIMFWIFFSKVLHGIAHNSFSVTRRSLISKWFIDHELALAMGIVSSTTTMGGGLGALFSPMLYEYADNLIFPFKLGAGLVGVGLICGVIVAVFDRYQDSKENENQSSPNSEKKFNLGAIRQLNLEYYVLALAYGLLSAVLVVFVNNGNDLIGKRFGFTMQMAGALLTLIFVISTIVSPVFGWVADRFGRKLYIFLFAVACGVVGLLHLTFLQDTLEENFYVIISLALIGVFYAGFHTIFWSCLSFIVPENVRTTGFGFIKTFQFLTSSVLLMGTGWIKDSTSETSHGYFWHPLSLGCCVLMSIALICWLLRVDQRMGEKLNAVGKNKNEHDDKSNLLSDDQNQIELGRNTIK